MKSKSDIEEDIELRDEEDETSDDAPLRKKEKRGKSKEQKSKERIIVFWTMVVVLLVTAFFWIMPILRGEKSLRQYGDAADQEEVQDQREGGYVKYDL